MLSLMILFFGCATDPCDQVAMALDARIQQCDIPFVPDEDDDGASACTIGDDTGACLTQCYRDAPCGALDGTSASDIAMFQACTADCLEP